MRRVRVGTSNKAVLVTGATGFMVRHVGRHLIEAGRLVVALARWRGGIFAQARVVKIGDKEINRLIELARCSDQLRCLNTDRAASDVSSSWLM